MPRRFRLTRRDFARHMTAGGLSFFAGAPLLAQSFTDQGLTAPGPGQGVDKGSLAHWGRLRFRCDNGITDNWSVHPHGDFTLVRAVNAQTSANLSEVWNVADVARLEEMQRFPLLFMHCETAPKLTDDEKQNLREYLLRGGFLYAEDCVNGNFAHGLPQGNWDFFFQRMHAVLPQLMPEARFERLPLDHPIFGCYYRLPGGQPHMQGQRHGGWGLTLKGRLLAYLSPSDAHCGWVSTRWFGRQKSEQAIKMGTNVYLYAMTH